MGYRPSIVGGSGESCGPKVAEHDEHCGGALTSCLCRIIRTASPHGDPKPSGLGTRGVGQVRRGQKAPCFRPSSHDHLLVFPPRVNLFKTQMALHFLEREMVPPQSLFPFSISSCRRPIGR